MQDNIEQKDVWINPEDRLPIDGLKVIGWCKSNPFSNYTPQILYWCKYGWVLSYNDQYVSSVAKWTYLPDAPILMEDE